ncbi:unnamed protein product [Linum trigynum]|uniref:Uncharacterized protein n=1 Tax=Linum trigynum TaxID=586398 RepID=A0AAV2D516_9ROSI
MADSMEGGSGRFLGSGRKLGKILGFGKGGRGFCFSWVVRGSERLSSSSTTTAADLEKGERRASFVGEEGFLWNIDSGKGKGKMVTIESD